MSSWDMRSSSRPILPSQLKEEHYRLPHPALMTPMYPGLVLLTCLIVGSGGAAPAASPLRTDKLQHIHLSLLRRCQLVSRRKARDWRAGKDQSSVPQQPRPSRPTVSPVMQGMTTQSC
jgi:hypothetical protein